MKTLLSAKPVSWYKATVGAAVLIVLFLYGGALWAQPGRVKSFSWDPNPTQMIGDVGSGQHLVVGNDWGGGKNEILMALYQNHDTTLTMSLVDPTYSVVAVHAVSNYQGRYILSGVVSDGSSERGFVLPVDSATLVPFTGTSYSGGDFVTPATICPMSGGGSIAMMEYSYWPRRDLVLTRLDVNGQPLWTKRYASDDGLRGIRVYEVGSGLDVYCQYNQAGSDRTAPAILRLDNSGNVLSCVYYPTLNDDGPVSVEKDAAGNSYIQIVSADTNTSLADVRLLCLDTALQVVWGKNYHYGEYNDPFFLYHWPGAGLYMGVTLSDSVSAKAMLSRLDMTGTVQWTNWYLSGDYPTLTGMMRLPNDEVLLTWTDYVLGAALRIVHIDSAGHFPSSCGSGAVPVQTTPYVTSPISVTVIDSGTVVQQPFSLAHYRHAKEVGEACQPLVSKAEPADAGLVIYPQPMVTRARIKLAQPEGAHLEAYDMQGRRVALETTVTTGGLELGRGNLPAGMYVLQGSDGDGRLLQGKLMIVD